MIRPPATATIEASALRANCAARWSMSTGGSVAMPSRSSATAANSSAVARPSAARAGLTTNSATAIWSHPGPSRHVPVAPVRGPLIHWSTAVEDQPPERVADDENDDAEQDAAAEREQHRAARRERDDDPDGRADQRG